MRQNCVLRSLENPVLNGFLLGLQAERDYLVVDPEFYPCCSADGSIFHEKTNMVQKCSLKLRLERSNTVILEFYKRHQQGDWNKLLFSANKTSRILRHVSDTLKGYGPQAKVIETSGEPSFELWHMALLCTWRFGIQAHVVTISEKNSSVRLPDAAATTGPLALFVEKLDKPWDPRQIEQLQACVAAAYNHNAFLWIEAFNCTMHQTAKPTASGPARVEEAFIKMNRIISKERSKSIIDYLDEDCISRLDSMQTSPLNTQQGQFNDSLV